MSGPVAERPRSPAEFFRHAELHRLKQRIIETTGLQYYADKAPVLAERAEQRRRLLGCGAAEYVARALDPHDGEELAALIDELTVGETYFFRYPEQFNALGKAVLSERVASHPQDPVLRIWSAGCASGAEPYSLTILLRRDLAGLTAGWQASILATDVNRKAIASARAGVFTNWELRTATEDVKRQCFVAREGNWEIRPEYREGVRFAHRNLVADMDGFAAANRGAFDIVFCRNVMIYFDAELMRRLLRLFSACLAPGGWLFVGHAEPYFEIANFLVPTVVAGTTLYRKPDVEFDRSGRVARAVRAWPVEEAAGPGLADAGLAATGGAAQDEAPAATSLPADDREPPGRAYGVSPPTPPHDEAAQPAAEPEVAPDARPHRVLDEIRRRADAGDWRAALDLCDQALRERPLDAALHYLHALIAEHRGEHAPAEQALGRAIYLDRGFALAHYHLGRCQAARGGRRAASRSFANVVKLLADRGATEPLAMGEGLVVAELRELAHAYLETLERSE